VDFQQFVHHAREHAANQPKAVGEKLAAGQSPSMLLITCADSRIVPARIIGAEAGSVFELRTAGNLIPQYSLDSPSSEMATIEFAVLQLGVTEIVVCGHSHCGAVSALHGTAIDHLPAMRGWLRSHRALVRRTLSEDPALRLEGQEHVRAQLLVLEDYPFVQERVASGDLSVHGWFYDVETGGVSTCEPAHGAFQPL
jgi:carbonic anhydrase